MGDEDPFLFYLSEEARKTSMNPLTASKTSRESPMQFDHLEIVGIAIEAGLSIMDVYDSSGQIEVQSKDDDPRLPKQT